MQFVVPSDSPGRAQPPWRDALGVLVFLACFLATCEWLRAALGRPHTSLLGSKLDLYAQDEQGYDVAFLGPSTTYRQIDPGVFDAVMAQGGHPLRSFNLGAPAMGGLEMRFALSQLLEIRPQRLRWLFIDLRFLDIEVREENLLSGRVTWWHDLQTTWFALRMVLDLEDEPDAARDMLVDHVRACAYRLANLGRLRLALEGLLSGTAEDRRAAADLEARRAAWELGPARNGFCSLEETVRIADAETAATVVERRTALQARADEYSERLLDKARGGPVRYELRPTVRQLLADIVATAGDAGVEVVFVTSPDVESTSDLLLAAWQEGLLPAFFDFSNPAVHRELFGLELRYDWNHLGERGAELYSRLLAERLLVLLGSRGAAREAPGEASIEGAPPGSRDDARGDSR